MAETKKVKNKKDEEKKVNSKDIQKNQENFAKAGKRSAKATSEASEKQAKEERKSSSSKTDPKPKQVAKPTRSKSERRSKNHKQASSEIENDKLYSAKDAIALAKKVAKTKFDSSVEIHIRLNVDPKQADQNIRDNVVLPAGTGKTLKVGAFVDDDKVKDAKSAGADFAGTEEITNKLDRGTIDFDVLIATPNLMAKLAKYARILGPRGLMPNPKSGTVTNDVTSAIAQAKAGRIEYRVDSTGIIHSAFGKVSFSEADLQTNLETLFASVKQNKPASIKGNFVKSINLSTTMGPSIKIEPSELS